jgi:hypothetical protein
VAVFCGEKPLTAADRAPLERLGLNPTGVTG